VIILSWFQQLQKKIQKEVKKAGTNNPFEIATNRNIIINYLPLGVTFGLYMKNARHQVITLNSDIDENLQRFVCAHELGHAILHPDQNAPFLHAKTLFSTARIECEANYFAVNLLLFGENLQNYETTQQIMQIYGIPKEMERFIVYESEGNW